MDTILSTRWQVYYGAENRQKRVVRDTSVTPTVTDTVNALYSALQDLFDELTQMDDGVPMSAQTPTEYTIGIIDAGDKDPWFIDRTSVEYLTAGALKTASWDRVTGTNTGIVKIQYTEGATVLIASDIGKTIANGTATGTILDYNTAISPKVMWIRPTDNTSTHDWSASSGVMTITGSTGNPSQSAAAVSAGESLWANIYSIGTIESNTHIYIYQNAANLVAYKATTDWWGDGHIDILVNVKELGTESDEGYISVLARQYSKTYSYYTVDLTNGGRNPIPLQTGNDLDNQTGYWQIIGSGATGTFVVGETISKSGSNKKGKITAVTGSPGATPTITYYLVGDPLTNFVNADTLVTGDTSGATTTVATGPTANGPSTGTLPTATFGGLATGGSFDVDENGTAENYSIVIDCNQQALTRVYEWSKYITRRGGTADIDSGAQTIEGQFYVGSEYRLEYTSLTLTVSDGALVTQTGGAGAGAKGTVVNHNTTDKILTLRNTRGTFSADGTAGSVRVQVDASNYVVMNSGTSTATAITPIAAAPFGTFAGGKFFAAPGVYLDDRLTADLNNFQLVDDNGTVRVAPIKVNVTIGNTRLGDKVAAFRLTAAGGDIQKDRYSATVQSAGATTLVIDTGGGITVDEPGKTSGGVIRLVDISATQEYRIRFASWVSSTFTLASSTGLTADAGSNTTTIVDAGVFATAKVGDLIRGVSPAAISYITVVTDANTVTISPAISGFTTGSTYEINTLPVATATDDTVYVPFIDAYEDTGTDGTPGSETVQIVRLADVPVRVRARRSGALSSRIIPFEQDSTIGTNGMSVSVIRSLDTIVT